MVRDYGTVRYYGTVRTVRWYGTMVRYDGPYTNPTIWTILHVSRLNLKDFPSIFQFQVGRFSSNLKKSRFGPIGKTIILVINWTFCKNTDLTRTRKPGSATDLTKEITKTNEVSFRSLSFRLPNYLLVLVIDSPENNKNQYLARKKKTILKFYKW